MDIILTTGYIVGGLFTIMMSFYLLLVFIQWISDIIDEKRWKKQEMKKLLIILFTFLIIACSTAPTFHAATIKTPTTQCGMCKQTIESSLSCIKGVNSVTVDLINYQTVIKYNPNRISLTDLELVISKSGYHANQVEADSIAYRNLHICCRLPNDRN